MRGRGHSGENAAVMHGGYERDIYSAVCKVAVTVVLVLWWVGMPEVGFYPVGRSDGHGIGTIWEHVLWPLSHANVWHLAGNLWVLWWRKGRLYVRESYVMAVVCSFLPVVPGLWEMIGGGENAAEMHRNAAEMHRAMATCGFSGVLCAMIGLKWGAWIRSCHDMTAYWTFAKKVLPFVALGFLIPHVNWSIHLYCLLVGLAYGRWQ